MKKENNLYVLKLVSIGMTAAVFIFLSLFYSEISMRGIKKGIYICMNSLVPSLFPFFVLSSFLIKIGFIDFIGRILSPPVSFIFNISGQSAGAFLLSLFGGYPVGAVTLNGLYESGQIEKDECRRMMLFSLNAGPAFVIGAVGTSFLKSRRAGVIIFVSLTLSSIILAFLTRFLENKREEKIKTKPVKTVFDPLREALPEAVSAGVSSIMNVCAWVLLFSCLMEFTEELNIKESTKDLLLCTLEVTRGCEQAARFKNLCLITFVLSWGGICVHCQILKYLKNCDVNFIHFFVLRIVGASLASLICFLLLKAFPTVSPVFINAENPVPVPFSVSAPSGISMLITGALLIFELDRKTKRC